VVDGNRGAARLGFASLLTLFTGHGRLAARRALPGSVVEFVARQVASRRRS
jgi:hypothetical protein